MDLKWIEKALDYECNEDGEESLFTESDVLDGFPLLQILSILSPSCVDLNWYSTKDALECQNISLRNYVTLRKGLRFIRDTPPTSLLQLSSHDPEILGSKLQKLHHEIDNVALELIEDAKTGQVEACMAITNSLRVIWDLCHSHSVTSDGQDDSELRDQQMQVDNGPSEEEITAPDNSEFYTPVERTFRPMVRWVLQTLITFFKDSNFSPQLGDELEFQLEQCSRSFEDNKVQVPGSVLAMLCQGHLYNFLNFFLLQGDSFFFPESFLQNTASSPAKENLIFLDNLIAERLLNINDNIFASVKDMATDQSPFYESIHINIMSAFMQSQISSCVKLDSIVDYLELVFPTSFDRSLTYPYDVEDALLLWINQCLITIKSKGLVKELGVMMASPATASKASPESEIELDDLISDVDDAWMISLVIHYSFTKESQESESFKELTCKKNLSIPEKLKNFQVLGEMATEYCPVSLQTPWLPADLVYAPSKSAYSGNASVLLINFLARLMEVCLKGQILFLPTATSSKTTAPRLSIENSAVDNVDRPPVEDSVKQPKLNQQVRPKQDSAIDIAKDEKMIQKSFASFIDEEEDRVVTGHEKEYQDLAEIESADVNEVEQGESPQNQNIENGRFSEYLGTVHMNSLESQTSKMEDAQEKNGGIEQEEMIKTLSMAIETLNSPSRIPTKINKRMVLPEIVKETETITTTTQNQHTPLDDVSIFTEKSPRRQVVREPRRRGKGPRQRRSGQGSKIVLQPIASSPPVQQQEPLQVLSAALATFPPSSDAFLTQVPKAIFDSAVDLHEEKSKAPQPEKQDPMIAEEEFSAPELLDNETDSPTNHSAQVEDVYSDQEEQNTDHVTSENILISNKALQMLLGEEEEEEQDGENNRNDSPPQLSQKMHDDSDSNESEEENDDDEAADQATLDIINNIKKIGMNMIENHEDEYEEYDDQQSSQNQKNQTQHSGLVIPDDTASDASAEEMSIIHHKEQSLKTDPTAKEEITELDILDFYEPEESLEEKEKHVEIQATSTPPPPQSRPKTGLMMYPIPETADDTRVSNEDNQGEEAWNRAQEATQKLSDTKAASSPLKGKTDEGHQKSSLEVLIAMKEERMRKQYETKVLKVKELQEKKKAQAEQQKRILEEKEKQRIITRTGQAPQQTSNASSDNNQIAAAAGPRRAKTPASKKRTLSTKTNKSIIKNALMHVSLAGSLNKDLKQEVIQDLTDSKATHFVLLFRDTNNFTFRGLYFWDPTLDQTLKLFAGTPGPTTIDARGVVEFYKYDCGARTFKSVPTKSFGRSVDAIAIGREYFLPKI